jgi:hypothetical protein
VWNVLWLGDTTDGGTLIFPPEKRVLQSYSHCRVLLPKLTAISIGFGPDIPKLLAGKHDCLDWLEMFLSPSPSFVEIDTAPIPGIALKTVPETVSAAVSNCPELEYLVFGFWSSR